MENEIKVNEYVRSLVNGNISKVLEISDLLEEPNVKYYKTGKFTGFCSTELYNVKHFPNLIDLIEVGDYVNGYKVISVDKDVTDIHTDCIELDLNNNYQYNFITINQIETIVTKEMMESISYKV